MAQLSKPTFPYFCSILALQDPQRDPVPSLKDSTPCPRKQAPTASGVHIGSGCIEYMAAASYENDRTEPAASRLLPGRNPPGKPAQYGSGVAVQKTTLSKSADKVGWGDHMPGIARRCSCYRAQSKSDHRRCGEYFDAGTFTVIHHIYSYSNSRSELLLLQESKTMESFTEARPPDLKAPHHLHTRHHLRCDDRMRCV